MERTDNNLDQFTKKVFKDAGLESPSVDFMRKVMHEVEKETSEATVYKPLNSKVGWFLIAGLLLIFAFVIQRFSMGWSVLGNWSLSELFASKYDFNFSIPKTYAYCFFFLLLFVLVQVGIIRRRFEKI